MLASKLTAANNTALVHFISENRSFFANAWTAFSYGFALAVLDVPIWKSVVVALIVLISCGSDLCRHEIRVAGVLFLAIALGVWTGLLPHPTHWGLK